MAQKRVTTSKRLAEGKEKFKTKKKQQLTNIEGLQHVQKEICIVLSHDKKKH